MKNSIPLSRWRERAGVRVGRYVSPSPQSSPRRGEDVLEGYVLNNMANNPEHKARFVVLLTACIDPGNIHSLARRDPAARLHDYQDALKFWLSLSRLRNIVFCDNSGVDLSAIQKTVRENNPDHKGVEVLSFYGQPVHPEFGKGYGEMRIIGHVLEHSRFIRDAEMVMKVTGRFVVKNAEAIAEAIRHADKVDVFCDLRRNLSTADSRVFCGTPHFLKNYFMPLQEIMNESAGICLEDVLARAVHRAMADGLRWSMLPYAHDLRGIAATADMKIPSSRWNFFLRKLFRAVKTAVLSR
jgi:hypothetical protein